MEVEQRKPADGIEEGWENGWDGHEQAQLRRMSRMSLYDKIGWLEEAHRMARHLQGNRTSEAHPEGPTPDEDECSPLKKGV